MEMETFSVFYLLLPLLPHCVFHLPPANQDLVHQGEKYKSTLLKTISVDFLSPGATLNNWAGQQQKGPLDRWRSAGLLLALVMVLQRRSTCDGSHLHVIRSTRALSSPLQSGKRRESLHAHQGPDPEPAAWSIQRNSPICCVCLTHLDTCKGPPKLPALTHTHAGTHK